MNSEISQEVYTVFSPLTLSSKDIRGVNFG